MQLLKDRTDVFRMANSGLRAANQVMNQTLFLGTNPGLFQPMLQQEIGIIIGFVYQQNKQ